MMSILTGLIISEFHLELKKVSTIILNISLEEQQHSSMSISNAEMFGRYIIKHKILVL